MAKDLTVPTDQMGWTPRVLYLAVQLAAQEVTVEPVAPREQFSIWVH